MLVNPKFEDFTKLPMWRNLSKDDKENILALQPVMIRRGIFSCATFGFSINLKGVNRKIIRNYPSLVDKNGDYFSCYGVCDTVDQVLEMCPELEFNEDRYFAISLTTVNKSEQSDCGGWRWHKWGPYIGTQNPLMEYLYDEPVIERVLAFHVHEFALE